MILSWWGQKDPGFIAAVRGGHISADEHPIDSARVYGVEIGLDLLGDFSKRIIATPLVNQLFIRTDYFEDRLHIGRITLFYPSYEPEKEDKFALAELLQTLASMDGQ